MHCQRRTILSNASTASRETLEPIIVPAGTGSFVDLGDHRAHAKITALQSAGTMLFAETEADFQGGVPAHTHAREDETFFILEGRFEFVIGGQAIEAGPRDTVFGPRNVSHSWRCTSLEGGRFLLLITPGANFEAFAMEMARRGYEPAAAVADPATRGEFLALCEEAGIAFDTGSA